MQHLRTQRQYPTLQMLITVDGQDHPIQVTYRDWRGPAIISERIRNCCTTIENDELPEINY
jgi:hypothetical protein